MFKFNYLIVVIFIPFKTSLCQNYGLPSGDVCLDFKKNLNSEFAKDCLQNLDECQQVMQLLQKGIRCVPACGERERCVMVHGGLQCNCTNGYEGENCSINIDDCASNPCQNGATCIDQINDYNCTCVPGYTGKNCDVDIDDCASNPCQNGATCIDHINDYNCTCVPGYAGKNCDVVDLTTNCNDHIVTTSGVYFLQENQRLKPVYCQVETVGRNWLVFQQRIDGSVDFYRNWAEYQRGFGDVEGNYWLGLDAIHAITSSGSYQLRVDLEDWSGNTAYALYSSFSVGSESSNYRLSVSGYSGTAGDSLNNHNNQEFSTFDRDNDVWGGNCAVQRHGAWWYRHCHRSNLNGEYQRGLTGGRSNSWWFWRNRHFSLKRSVMKIRPN